MPKIIDEAKTKILNSAKTRLLEKGYSSLTLRGVAADCEIAVGTIYNYFPNKDMLVGEIMIEDWFFALSSMEKGVAEALNIGEGMAAVYNAIVKFSSRYEGVWSQFVQTSSETGITRERHLLLRTQISERLKALLEKFDQKDVLSLCPLLAETILAAALQPDMDYSLFAQMTSRLFHEAK